MSFFKKLFSSGTKDSGNKDKKTGAIAKKGLNPEHKQIVELYTQKNPTPLTSKEIVESIAKELGKKPGGVRSILSKAGVYIKQEKLTYNNNKELLFKKIASDRPGWGYSQLSDELKNDKEIAVMAITKSAFAYNDLPEKLKYDKDFLIKSIEIVKEKDAEYVQYIFDYDVVTYFKDDKEVFIKAWNSLNPKTRQITHIFPASATGTYEEDYPGLLRDGQFMLEAIKENHLNYLDVSPALRDDAEFLDIVGADDFSDYCDRVHPRLLEERRYSDPEDDEDDEVIEIP